VVTGEAQLAWEAILRVARVRVLCRTRRSTRMNRRVGHNKQSVRERVSQEGSCPTHDMCRQCFPGQL
jgi:hypothetical protein